MPFIRSFALERYLRLVLLILSLSEIMSSCSCYIEKRLSYVAILALSGRQPFSCIKYTRANIWLSCDIHLVFTAKYMFLYIRYSSLVLYLICYRVLRSSIRYKTRK